MLLRDPALLGATIGRIYDCVLHPESWQPVMADLGALIGSRRVTMGVVTAGGQVPALGIQHGVDADDPWDQYAPINPLLPLGLTWPIDKAFVALRDYGAEALTATRYHREYLAPRGMRDALYLLAIRDGATFGGLTVITHDDRGPITDEEAAGFELVAPHVRRAIEISNVLGAQRLAAETYRAALDELEAAVLILDAGGRLSFANPAAEALLARGRALRLAGGKLRGATEATEQVLRRALAAQGGFEALLGEPDGQEHLLFAVSLDPALEGPFSLDGRSTLLILRAPRAESLNPVAIAGRVFGLTRAQMQVLTFLAQGHPPEAIADIIGVSVSTVRTHLAELFRRTDTARQAELLARTLSLASPLRGGARDGTA